MPVLRRPPTIEAFVSKLYTVDHDLYTLVVLSNVSASGTGVNYALNIIAL